MSKTALERQRPRCRGALAQCRRRDSNPRHADYDSRPLWLSHRGFEAGWTSRWTQPHLRPRRVLRVRALQPRHRPHGEALARDRSGLRWEQGWEQGGSKSRLRMALAVRSCPPRNPLLCREFSMNARHTGPLGPPSTEPKVRGSNPLGRARTPHGCWAFADLTFDLEGRGSNRTGRGFKRLSVAVRGPVRFPGDFRGDARDGSPAGGDGSYSIDKPPLQRVTSALVWVERLVQPVSLAISWPVARAAELRALSQVASSTSSPSTFSAHARWMAS